MSDVVFRNVTKQFDDVQVIPSLNLAIDSGSFTVLLGPSGCGKSTLLRMVAGLEDATDGDILIGGKRVNDLRASERNIAMVFQSYGLYPHLSVAGNLGFPLQVARLPRETIKRKVEEVAAKLGLTPYLARKPKQLSGGQRQRVALGRAMVRDPQVFLFDEPLSNLDASMREEMRSELIAFHRALAKTMIYVTHDQVEAMTMAQRIVVMRQGVIQQAGTPREIYKQPENTFVAKFIGSPPMNLLPAAAFGVQLGAAVKSHIAPTALVGCRPEDIGLMPPSEPHYALPARIASLQPLGAALLIECELESVAARVSVLAPWREGDLQIGHAQMLHLPKASCLLFDGEQGRRLRG
ncbi:MAG TPA: ABC transporter ATP-binding protein [Dongiaceae bacterium]|nr:ABC transporter ATP-binding protein [Dongiaceae bacterium]